MAPPGVIPEFWFDHHLAFVLKLDPRHLLVLKNFVRVLVSWGNVRRIVFHFSFELRVKNLKDKPLSNPFYASILQVHYPQVRQTPGSQMLTRHPLRTTRMTKTEFAIAKQQWVSLFILFCFVCCISLTRPFMRHI